MRRHEFEPLALLCLDDLFRVCCCLVRTREEAEDIVQEVYARALRPESMGRFVPVCPDRADAVRRWLFQIAHNVAMSSLKSASRERRRIAVRARNSRALATPTGLAQAVRDADLAALPEALNQLPALYREILVLSSVGGLKYREIADILSIPIGTVMSRLHRAKAVVAARLTDPAEHREVTPKVAQFLPERRPRVAQ